MKSIITKNGLNIMNQNRADGTVQYWIGYYGLAYIPDEVRELTENTTELVEGNKGDVIYNLFQGGMTPAGFDTDSDSSSMASRLMNSCMYTGSVINKYRYVLDTNDNNQLVVLADYQPEGDELGLREFATFSGVSADSETSELPIPAPLYYLGEPVAYTSTQNVDDMPSVSCDTRVYRASSDALTGTVNDDATILSRAAIYDWFDSEENVYTKTYSNRDTYRTLDQYWKYQSVSNFNRFHAPANVSGYAVDYEPACRNLSKATRLFPISHYDVIDTKDDVTVSQVKYTISIDMDTVFSKITKRTNVYYNGEGVKQSTNPYKVGFKFNRIGVYAVPVTLHAYNTETDSEGNCENHTVQMQISGNEEPQLFAILDLDTPIIMSEGNVTKYDVNFQIDFGDSGSVVDSAAIYYNLYEDDAITWYKNQLIANASTAEAVTSLGVQMNYLRKQMNDTVTNGQYLCGIGDTGDKYVVNNTVSSVQNVINIGYIYHDDSYVGPDEEEHKDTDVNENPLSDDFIGRIDEILAAGSVPFIMYGCDEYNLSDPSKELGGTIPDIKLGGTCSHCSTEISHRGRPVIRFAPLVKISACSYYFANPMDAGCTIVLHENSRIEFRKNTSVDEWHRYKI